MTSDKLTGSTRYLRQTGEAVRILIRWHGKRPEPWHGIPMVWFARSDGRPPARSDPHNVLVERADGSRCVMNYDLRGTGRSHGTTVHAIDATDWEHRLSARQMLIPSARDGYFDFRKVNLNILKIVCQCVPFGDDLRDR